MELHYPYHNSDILAKYITLQSKKNRFLRIQKKIFSKAKFRWNKRIMSAIDSKHIKNGLPYQLTGIQLILSGRLLKERNRPRKTVQFAQFGSFAINTSSYVNSAIATRKNKKGTYSIKVLMTQKKIDDNMLA